MRFVLLLVVAACEGSPAAFTAHATMSTDAPSAHRTWCTTLVLDNPSPITATEIVVDFDGADRVVVYRAGATAAQRDQACDPLAQGAPLAIARRTGEGLRSDGHGFVLDAHQRLLIESGSDRANTMRVEVAVTHDEAAAPLEVIDIRRDGIALEPNQVGTASTFYPLPAEHGDARFVAFAARTGEHGIAAQIATAAGPTDDRVLVYYTKAHRWSAPELTPADPARIPKGGGIFVQCEYYNTSDRRIADERCGAWAYFTP